MSLFPFLNKEDDLKIDDDEDHQDQISSSTYQWFLRNYSKVNEKNQTVIQYCRKRIKYLVNKFQKEGKIEVVEQDILTELYDVRYKEGMRRRCLVLKSV